MSHEPHPTQQKIDTVKDLTELLQQAKGIYLADFSGLNVEKTNELRNDL
ncbi:50S ribosomal protein L10, partial [bacterium]|nr:50S ribosomal protein L10 [bacterium]